MKDKASLLCLLYKYLPYGVWRKKKTELKCTSVAENWLRLVITGKKSARRLGSRRRRYWQYLDVLRQYIYVGRWEGQWDHKFLPYLVKLFFTMFSLFPFLYTTYEVVFFSLHRRLVCFSLLHLTLNIRISSWKFRPILFIISFSIELSMWMFIVAGSKSQ